MTKEELKRKLRAAWICQKKLESDTQKLQDLRDLSLKITTCYSEFTNHGSPEGAKMSAVISRIVDLEKDIIDDMDMLYGALNDIRSMVKSVQDQKLQLVLQKRYLCYQRWEQIAADMHYSWRGIHKLHNAALNMLLKNFG